MYIFPQIVTYNVRIAMRWVVRGAVASLLVISQRSYYLKLQGQEDKQSISRSHEFKKFLDNLVVSSDIFMINSEINKYSNLQFLFIFGQ